ncbi:ribonuclease HI [Pseudomonas aeruginosa]|uniref:ribonuclease HI n=1 Tax=Pseudomonas aeruginosa TaxID=287 RepID=UPI00065A25DA|nr:ribonuclease HI [Pseudomonas aeruginosa]CRP88680.1 Ribonuclease HI [Pseudomonas aeruginosa]
MSKTKRNDRYVIYTDGSALGNPGPGGYGVYAKYKGEEFTLSKGYYKTTNNRQELMSVIAALEEFGPNIKVDIFTDSQYVIKCATKWMRGWIRNNWMGYNSGQPVKNRDLLEVLNELLKKNKVKFHWVKGHSGDEGNEKADQLAKDAANNPEAHDMEYMKVLGF